jgi:hypothetical protein
VAHSKADITLMSGKIEVYNKIYESCEIMLFWVTIVEH